MAGFTNYFENELIDHLMRGSAGAYTLPSTLYLALFTVDPDYEAGTGGTEVTGGSYARYSLTMNSTNWAAATDATPNGKKVTNAVAFTYTTATASWGTVIGALLVDTASGAWTNAYWGEQLTVDKLVGNGDTFEFPIGNIELSLDKATAAGISNFWKAEILDHACSTARTYSAPATAYLALFTAAPNYLAGTGGTEVSTVGTAYAREAITMNAAWDAASGGLVDNTGAIPYDTATADWGTVVGAMLVDQVSGAWTNVYAGKNLTASKLVENGDTFSIAAGDFDASLD
jgi:hypothetical protein